MTSSVKIMLDMKSIDVEARDGGDFCGMTCLIIAAAFGFLDICRLLIDKGARVKAKDRNGYTPLYYAAEKGRIEIVRLLCDRGADVEARTSGWPPGSRPLHLAAMYGHISVVKELIEVRNADINARDDDGRTALMYARGNSHDTVVYLISKGGIE
jgi:ankyrin repeat protein